MEAVDNQDILLGLRYIESRYDLTRETLATIVHSRNTETVKRIRFDIQDGRGLISFEIAAIVKTVIPYSCINNVSRGRGRGLVDVGNSIPAESCLSLFRQLNTQVIGSQGRNGIVGVMHPADITEQSLVDTAGKVELEVGVLAEAHIGKVLMRHGLQDGTRHFGNTGFGIVPVPELTHLPVAILPDHIPWHRREQLIGKVTRQEPRMASAQNAVIQIGGTDGQCSRM